MDDHVNLGLYELYLTQAEQRKLKEILEGRVEMWEDKILLVGRHKFLECLFEALENETIDPFKFIDSSLLREKYLRELSELNSRFLLEHSGNLDSRTMATAMSYMGGIDRDTKKKLLQRIDEVNKNMDCQE